MLTESQQQAYDQFYESTHHNTFLDSRTETLIGLAAAMAMNCEPCTHYYLKLAKRNGIKRGEIAEVLAKVMAVAAGQKRLQMQTVLAEHAIDLSQFD